MCRAFILSLPIDCLGASQDYLLDGKVLVNDDFVKEGCATIIYQGEFTEVGKITLICREVKDGIYPPKCPLHVASILNISEDEFNLISNIIWLSPLGVNRGFEAV